MATEQIPTSIIADDAVTNAKIGADAVSTTEIANDASISTSGNIATTGSGTLTVAGNTTLSGTNNLGSNPTVTLGANATFPAGHVIQTTKTGSVSGSHGTTSSTSFVDTGISVNPPATSSSSNYMIITMSISGHLYNGQGIEFELRVSYNGGSEAALGSTTGPHYQKREGSTNTYEVFNKTWYDQNTGNLNTGTGATYKLYVKNLVSHGSSLYFTHNAMPWILMAQEIQA